MADERGYLDLLNSAASTGEHRMDRTGTGTRSLFGAQLRFSLRDGQVPVISTKKMAWKTCLRELLWFLRGSTNSKDLESQGVKIWQGNTTRAFLDARGLHDLPEGDIGAGYGFQWRHFGAPYIDCYTDYTDMGIDQLAYVEELIKNDPTSRRIFMSAWNPEAMDRMALPPCHVSCQFYVSQNGLCCHMYQRSADLFLGLPFNIMSYGVLTHVLAFRAGIQAKELVISIGDAHVYDNHVEQIQEQISRAPYAFPRLTLNDRVKTIDWSEMTISDFDLEGYQCHPAIAAPMSA
jgi:thymidylate synthase